MKVSLSAILPLKNSGFGNVIESFCLSRKVLFSEFNFNCIFLPRLNSIALVQSGSGVVSLGREEASLSRNLFEVVVHFNKFK